MSKNKDKVRIRFIGKNSDSVTGSSTLIEMSGYKILLEHGLYQSNSLKNDYQINSRRTEFKPSEIDYIFLMHLHIDHCGLIPRLYANGCKAKIIVPTGSKELFRVMTHDSAFIMSRDVETLQRKYKMDVSPIYTSDDADVAANHFCEYGFGEVIKLNDSISFRFVPSGHIINSAQLELWLTEGNHTSKILYTSDLGNVSIPKHYVAAFEPVDHANVAIVETTYGDNKHSANMKTREKDIEKIKSVIETTCIDNKHKVLIPIFSLDRAQNILTHLYDLFGNDSNFNIPVLIDSPLTVKICKLYSSLLDGDELAKYEQVLSWPNIKFISEYADSVEWQKKKEPMIVLSAPGFLQCGRSRAWTASLLPDAKNYIIFVGYSSEDSLAGKIKLGKQHKTLTIDGKQIPNRCGIINLTSFTSHIQFTDMLKYYSDINAEKICLVHGEFAGKCEFAKELQDEISKKSKTAKVLIINKGSEVVL